MAEHKIKIDGFAQSMREDTPPTWWEQHLRPAGELTALESLQVYRASYRIRLEEALKKTFPKAIGYISEERIAPLAKSYVQTYSGGPSSIERFCHGFVSYVQKHLRDPILISLMSYEVSFYRVFIAPNGLSSKDENMQNMSMMAFASTQLDLLDVIMLAVPARAAQELGFTVSEDDALVHLVQWQEDYNVKVHRISAAASQCIRLMSKSDLVPEVSSRSISITPEFLSTQLQAQAWSPEEIAESFQIIHRLGLFRLDKKAIRIDELSTSPNHGVQHEEK